MWETISNFAKSAVSGVSITNYLVVGLAALLIGLYGGYHYESIKFDDFKVRTIAEAKIQEAKTKEVISEQKQITQQVKDDYEAKIADIKRTYTNRVRINPSSGEVSTLPATAGGSDEITSNGLFIQQCAQTTTQLIFLQEWINNEFKK